MKGRGNEEKKKKTYIKTPFRGPRRPQHHNVLWLLFRILTVLVALFLSLVNFWVGTYQDDQLLLFRQHFFPGQQQQQPPEEANVVAESLTLKNDSSWKPQQQQQDSVPPLDTIIQGWNVIGNVSWLLNFAIVGFPKCGTSSLMYQLQAHPQVQIFTDERCDLGYDKPTWLIRDLYQQQQQQRVDQANTTTTTTRSTTDPRHPKRQIRGLKCPSDLESTALALPHYRHHFPDTRLLVGLRHPILWLESFYNFRLRNGAPMPTAPQALIGKCRKGLYNVCTYRAHFHLYLAHLLGTAGQSVYPYLAPRWHKAVHLNVLGNQTRPVFVYEVSQLADEDHAPDFLSSLQRFLGLELPFGSSTTAHYNQSRSSLVWFRPGRPPNTTSSSLRTPFMDICESPKYDLLRRVLLEQATNASRWIQRHFVHATNVVVAAPQSQFVHLLDRWRVDPCVERRKQRQQRTAAP